MKCPVWSTPTWLNGGTHFALYAGRGGGSGLLMVPPLMFWQTTHLRRRLLMRERILGVQYRWRYNESVCERAMWLWDEWIWVISKSTKLDLLGRNNGVITSSGRSDLTILPLALIRSLSRYKSSCLMVNLTSRLTFTLLFLRYAWMELQWYICSYLTNFSNALDGIWQNSKTRDMTLSTLVNELNWGDRWLAG